MNQYTLWQYRSGHWYRLGIVAATSAERALEMQGGNYNPLPQCITDGANPNNNSSCILAGVIL